MDTPGQVEVFTWSASGSIICQTLSSKYPTVILFVVDTVQSHSPKTFMSNLLFASSLVYKFKLPLVLVMNKSDVIDPSFAVEWMRDSDKFNFEIDKERSYMACLNQSLLSTLDTFYENIPVVSVSAKTGAGLDSLVAAIQDGVVKHRNEADLDVLGEQLEKNAKISEDKENSASVSLNPEFVEMQHAKPDRF